MGIWPMRFQLIAKNRLDSKRGFVSMYTMCVVYDDFVRFGGVPSEASEERVISGLMSSIQILSR